MNKEPTHKVVITATSHRDTPEVAVHIEYGPIEKNYDDGLGEYKPAAYEFIERALTMAAAVSEEDFEIESYEGGTLN